MAPLVYKSQQYEEGNWPKAQNSVFSENEGFTSAGLASLVVETHNMK